VAVLRIETSGLATEPFSALAESKFQGGVPARGGGNFFFSMIQSDYFKFEMIHITPQSEKSW
jgi:hypothetical protein